MYGGILISEFLIETWKVSHSKLEPVKYLIRNWNEEDLNYISYYFGKFKTKKTALKEPALKCIYL